MQEVKRLLFAVSLLLACKGDPTLSLVIVHVNSAEPLPDVRQVSITVGTHGERTFDVMGLSDVDVQFGVYVPRALMGQQLVTARARMGAGASCVLYRDNATANLRKLGEVVQVFVTLMKGPRCDEIAGDGGMGADGGSAADRPSSDAPPTDGARDTTAATDRPGDTRVTNDGPLVLGPPPDLAFTCKEYRHDQDPCDPRNNIGTLIRTVAFTRAGDMFATGGDNGYVKLWKVVDGVPTEQPAPFNALGDAYVAFSPDGTLIAIGSRRGQLELRKVSDRSPVASLVGHADSIYGLGFSSDGSYLVTADSAKQVILWSVAGRSLMRRTMVPMTPQAFAVSPVSTTTSLPVAIGQNDGSVVMMDILASTLPVITFVASTTTAESAAFSPDGTTLAVGTYGGIVTTWKGSIKDGFTKSADVIVSPAKGSAYALDFSPDGKHIVAGMFNFGLVLAEGTTLKSDYRTMYSPMSVSFSPNGRAIVAGQRHCGGFTYCE